MADLEEEVLLGDPEGVVAERVRSLGLRDCVGIGCDLRVRTPGARHLDLRHQAELHGPGLPFSGSVVRGEKG
jgi:hypothetical protein